MKSQQKGPRDDTRTSLPIISLRDLEHRLGEDRITLRALAGNWRNEYSPFQQAKDPKPFQRVSAPGKIREIDNPSKELKRVQKKILHLLLQDVKFPHFQFGAVSGRDVKKHAAEHLRRGRVCIVKMDVKNFYPSVTSHHVYFVWRNILLCSSDVASLLTKLTTYKWRLPQGAPTSPALANIFLASIYGPVLEACEVNSITPTAWVDDLVFSGGEARSVMELVRQALAANGFKMSRKKRIILTARDSKVITGVRLGASETRAPKEKIRDLRAAIHKLLIGRIEARDRGKYLESLMGRVNHIESLCARDARRLKSDLERAKVTSPPTPSLP